MTNNGSQTEANHRPNHGSSGAEPARVVVADLAYTRMGVAPTAFVLDTDGVILQIGAPKDVLGAPKLRNVPSVILRDRLVLPGVCNAHSHAFQRLIRGRVHVRSAGQNDFWGWRALMYRCALKVSPEQMFAVARFVFAEMLLNGFVGVGEFHYIHHGADGRPYANRVEMAEAVISAARAVGMPISLLRVLYNRGGFGVEPSSAQVRFVDEKFDDAWADIESLRQHQMPGRVQIGVAPHSIRAVPAAWLTELANVRSSDMPVHMHLSEQTRELEESTAEYGCTPLLAVDQVAPNLLDASFTAVHATHFSEDEISLSQARGIGVCACPTTERDLGDGFLPGRALLRAGVPISVGTDSHAQIDVFEEIRLIEMHERLLGRDRCVWSSDDAPDAGERLYADVAAAGAKALRIGDYAGELRVGAPFHAISVDLQSTRLLGVGGLGADLGDASGVGAVSAAVFSGCGADIRDVFVHGEPLVSDGRLANWEVIATDYRAVAKALL